MKLFVSIICIVTHVSRLLTLQILREPGIPFRQDYVYLEEVESYYKLHETEKNWYEAKQACETENASLYYPESKNEADLVISFWKSKKNRNNLFMFVGISDIVTRRISGYVIRRISAFRTKMISALRTKRIPTIGTKRIPASRTETLFWTVDGKPISDVHEKWGAGEPGQEKCVKMNGDAEYQVANCEKVKLRFICMKDIQSKDYTYLAETKRNYKFTPGLQNWYNAKQKCGYDGAELFYPKNEAEAVVVTSKVWAKHGKPNKLQWVFLGIARFKTKRTFWTVDGKPISEVYLKWYAGEPNNYEGYENCVDMSTETQLNDVNCAKQKHFICKKAGQSTDYTYLANTRSSYKFHKELQNWHDAKRKCDEDGAKLFYPDNQAEATAVVSEIVKKIKPAVTTSIFLGITDYRTKRNFVTIHGKSISTVYEKWRAGQPDNRNGSENCVDMNQAGEYSDVNCYKKVPFICKRTLDSLSIGDNATCPNICPSRDVMICAKNKHGIYQSFSSVCHLRMYACNHPEEKMKLISRVPCIQSSPFLSEPQMKPKGRIEAPDENDVVLRFIKCRDKGELAKYGNPLDSECMTME